MSSDTTNKCNKKGITMKYYITDDNFNVLSIHPDRESAKAVWDVNWKAGVDVYLESEENHLKNIEWAKDYRERKKKREQYAVSVMLEEEKAEREYLKELNNKIGGGKSAILEDIIIKESLNEIKVNHELFESAEDKAIKEMEEEYKEIDKLVKEDLERKEIEKVTGDLWKDMSKDIIFEFDEDDVKPMSFEFEEAAQREALEDMVKQDDLKLLTMLQDHIKNKEGRIINNLWNEPTEDCDDCLWIIKETDGDVTVCNECLKERNNK